MNESSVRNQNKRQPQYTDTSTEMDKSISAILPVLVVSFIFRPTARHVLWPPEFWRQRIVGWRRSLARLRADTPPHFRSKSRQVPALEKALAPRPRRPGSAHP